MHMEACGVGFLEFSSTNLIWIQSTRVTLHFKKLKKASYCSLSLRFWLICDKKQKQQQQQQQQNTFINVFKFSPLPMLLRYGTKYHDV